MIFSLVVSFLAMAASPSVAELEASCEQFQAEYGGEADCGCLAEKVAADDDLLAMAEAITTVEELESAPEELTDAIADCTD